MTLRRTGPPQRRTRLKSGGPPSRKQRLRASSRRADAIQAVRNELFRPYLNSTCRIPSPVCTGRADAFHELVGRIQGGSKVDPRNLVPCANTCNTWIEDNPSVAQLKGWKVPAWQATVGHGGLVPAVPSPLTIAGDWT